MNIPTLTTILGAHGTGTPSAVAGAELPGAGEKGFACLVQMLLTEQQSSPSSPAVPGAQGSPTDAGAVPATQASPTDAGAVPATQASPTDADAVPAADPPAGQDSPRPGDGTATPPVADTGPAAPDDAPANAAPQAANVAYDALAPTQAGLPAGAPVQAAPNGRPEARTAVAAAVAEQAGSALEATRTGGHSATSTAPVSAEPAPPNPAPRPAITLGGAHGPTVSPAEGPPTAETNPVPPQLNNASATVSVASAPAHAPGPSTAQAGHAQAGGPVGGQVFPEIARLVTRGDGTQRLTLRLSPENLGEVRIVVTVRDGAVDISLAAGAEAQEALRHGSGDLRRLLEGVGAAGTQIVVRDLPATSAAQAGAQPFGTGTAATYADGQAPGREHQRGGHDRHPATPDGRRHTDAGARQTANPAPASAAGVDLKL